MYKEPEDYFTSGEVRFFVGVVENTADPLQAGRVQVRAFAYHPERGAGAVATADLPWAYVMLPTTASGLSGIGSNHDLKDGSWVVGMFLDGRDAQQAVVMGSLVGTPGLTSAQQSLVNNGQGIASAGPGGVTGMFQTLLGNAQKSLGAGGIFGATPGNQLNLTSFLGNRDATQALSMLKTAADPQGAPMSVQPLSQAFNSQALNTQIRTAGGWSSAVQSFTGLGNSVLTAGGAEGFSGSSPSPLSGATVGSTTTPQTPENTTIDVQVDYEELVKDSTATSLTISSTGTPKQSRYLGKPTDADFLITPQGTVQKKGKGGKIVLVGGLPAAGAQAGQNMDAMPVDSKFYNIQLVVLQKLVRAFEKKGGKDMKVNGAPGFNVSEWARTTYPKAAGSGGGATPAPAAATDYMANPRGFIGGPARPVPSYAGTRQSDVPIIARTNSITGGRGLAGKGTQHGGPGQPYLAKMIEPTQYHHHVARPADSLDARKVPDKWQVPEYPHGGEYGQAQVVKTTEGGHHILLDDTPGRQKVELMHSTGSSMQIQADGSGIFYIKKDKYEVVLGDGKIGINGSLDLSVGGDMRVSVKGDLTWDVTGKVHHNINGDWHELVMGNKSAVTVGSELNQVKKNMVQRVGKDMDLAAGGKMNTTINGTQQEVVRGNKTSTVKGESQEFVQGNRNTLVYGTHATHAANWVAQSTGEFVAATRGNMMMSANAKIGMASTDDMNFSSGADINTFASANMKTKAGSNMDIYSGAQIKQQSAASMHLKAGGQFIADSEGSNNIKSGLAVNVEAGGDLNLNGQSAVNVDAGSSLNLKASDKIKADKMDVQDELHVENIYTTVNAFDSASPPGSAGNATAATAAAQAEIIASMQVQDPPEEGLRDESNAADSDANINAEQPPMGETDKLVAEDEKGASGGQPPGGLHSGGATGDGSSLYGNGETGGGGGSNVPPSSLGDKTATGCDIANSLVNDYGWTPEQASAAVGNMMQESGLNPGALVTDTNGLASGGLIQWNGPRLTAMQNWTATNGYDWRSTSGQLAYLNHEARNVESAGGPLLSSTNLYDAHMAMQGYERFAGYQNLNATRYGYTQGVYQDCFGGTAPGAGGSGETPPSDASTGTSEDVVPSKYEKAPYSGCDPNSLDKGNKLSPNFTLGDLTPTSHPVYGSNKTGSGSLPHTTIVTNLSGVAMNVCETILSGLGRPHIISGYRSYAYNRKVGGARRSDHMKGQAVDVTVPGMSPRALASWVEKNVPTVGGIGIYSSFTHFSYYIGGNGGRIKRW